MGLFKKKKQEEPIPQSLSILPPQSPFPNEDNIDDDLADEEDEEESEVEEEIAKEEPKLIVKEADVQFNVRPIEETEEDIDSERENLQKKIDKLNEKIALKKEIEEEKKKEELEKENKLPPNLSSQPVSFEDRTIVTFQNHEERLRNIEAALFRLRSSI